MKTLKLSSKLEDLYTLNEFIEEILSKEDFPTNLIIEEVFVNIVNYSNCDYIQINAEYEDSILHLEFIDNGIEFNPLLAESPDFTDNIDDAKIGGLGIHLTKETADELSYSYYNNENHLKITKKVE